MVGVCKGKFLQTGKLRPAQFCSQPMAEPGGKNGRTLTQDQGDQSKKDHLCAFCQNITPVSVRHAYIHDRSHYKRDHQLKNGFCDNAERSQNPIPAVRAQIRHKFFHKS